MSIHVANLCEAKVKVADIKKDLRKVLKGEGKESVGINVVFCNDKKILELNRRFRQISKPTDVLSFPFNDSDLLGEVYISLDTADRQADKNGHNLDKEIHRLVIHGVVHLLGYDHKKKRDMERMESVEAKYL